MLKPLRLRGAAGCGKHVHQAPAPQYTTFGDTEANKPCCSVRYIVQISTAEISSLLNITPAGARRT